MSLTINNNYGQVNHIENSSVVITPAGITAESGVKTEIRQEESVTLATPVREVNKEKLAKYFKAQYRGMGGHTDRYSKLVEELQQDFSDADFCRIAVMLYESDVLNSSRPNTFKQWYKIFCEAVGCPYDEKREPRHYKPDEAMKIRFGV